MILLKQTETSLGLLLTLPQAQYQANHVTQSHSETIVLVLSRSTNQSSVPLKISGLQTFAYDGKCTVGFRPSKMFTPPTWPKYLTISKTKYVFPIYQIKIHDKELKWWKPSTSSPFGYLAHNNKTTKVILIPSGKA